MASNYKRFLTNQLLPGRPTASYDSLRKALVHIYQHIPLQPTNFQTEINYYLGRKESYSGNVLVVSKIKDQQITYHLGKANMEISVVTDYVPWRLHLQNNRLSFEEALYLLRGACKGFRQLLHRVRSPFIVQGSMIGVDGSGQVKVWWNQLFYKSSFGFAMTANIKLKEMVKSLIDAVLNKAEMSASYKIEELLINYSETFAVLQERINDIAQGIDLKSFGRSLILKNEEHLIVIKQCKPLWNIKENSILEGSRISVGSGKAQYSSEKVILSPRKTEALEFSKKIITKRVYRDGTSPDASEKMKIIKDDIENLRSVVEKNQPFQLQERLRLSKSVDALVSIRTSMKGDTTIPEVKNLIASSQMIQSENCTVSRFIEPNAESSTSIVHQNNFISSQQFNQNNQGSPLVISRLQQLTGQEKSVNSTSRSINDSRLEKRISIESNRPKFGESEKKMPENIYFTSFFET